MLLLTVQPAEEKKEFELRNDDSLPAPFQSWNSSLYFFFETFINLHVITSSFSRPTCKSVKT